MEEKKMNLREYLEKNNLSPEWIAMIANLSVSTIYKILKNVEVGPGSARKIYIATGGLVHLNIPYNSKVSYIKYLKSLDATKKTNSKTSMGRSKREAVLL